jgi:hypothetical protein
LTAISTHPKVNPGWLLTGEGDALLPEREETPIGGFAIPIAKRPLPGPPQEYLTLLSGEAFPVARPFYLPTRYWLEIQATDRIAGDVRQRVEAGDLLLIDTHLALRGDLDAVDGRLCIASRIAKKGTEFILGAVERQFETEEEPEGLMMDTFVKPSTFGDTGRDYLLHVPDSGQPSIRRTSPPRNALMENIKSIELQDIVGVCVLIVRRCT